MRHRKWIKLAKMLALAVMAVCLIQIGRACYESARNRAQQERLREMMAEEPARYPQGNAGALQDTPVSALPDRAQEGGGAGDTPQDSPAILEKYASLYEENTDLVGWLSIEGTPIDYPVMQSGDDRFYLSHDFYLYNSKYGCLFVKGQADVNAGANFIIYGHNMSDGSMFGELDSYLQESFYKEHPSVSFDTLYEERVYEIVAVFLSKVYNADEEVFKYYEFYEAGTQEEFDAFFSNIKELSLYDTGVEAQSGDTFLTLSTCDNYVKDGRLVVVARRVE